MKKIRRSYCSACSTEKEDERDLEIINKIIRCLNCGMIQMWIPEDQSSPYHYLAPVEEREYGRRI